MSSAGKAWIVAASIAAVEALKDQGFARWNYAMRSAHQHAKSNLRSYSQAKKLSSPSSSAAVARGLKRLEESHGKIMHLNSWGPESTRF
ncbi:uncharacterized protein LOC115754725 [Rhodamnia argentea]|uniref:Uncharacterized protein LOC115754725 n=1 Tax=Rhodamnia argentea TaxID=178133 RepID=A0A8B8QTI2_9MYRT|nr:uncharacterized protein LOC115754725 [Rhodamnia argentea]